jgi:transcriptional regulator with XRE-family HTH domain
VNQALAENIKSLREEHSWTQEQLAEAAQLHHRTIQRAEAGQGASAETLLAIAGALDVDVDLLRFDGMGFLAQELGVPREQLTPEFIAQKKRELVDPKFATVHLARIAASADFRTVADAMAMFFDCTTKRDDIQDEAAALQSELNDLLMVGSDIDPTFRRTCEVAAFDHVKRLESLGAVVTIGLRKHSLVVDKQEPIPWVTLFVIVAPEREEKKFLLVPRQQPIRFA